MACTKIQSIPAEKIMKVDYKFCKKTKLTPKDLFIWLNLKFEDGDGEVIYNIFNRHIRIINTYVDISEEITTFDRWANSSELEFDLARPSEKRRFIDWVEHQRTIYPVDSTAQPKESLEVSDNSGNDDIEDTSDTELEDITDTRIEATGVTEIENNSAEPHDLPTSDIAEEIAVS